VGARNEIVIKTGNAGALDISFNGKKLGSAGANKEVKTLRFDPTVCGSRSTRPDRQIHRYRLTPLMAA
jgi:hypothetical protein